MRTTRRNILLTGISTAALSAAQAQTRAPGRLRVSDNGRFLTQNGAPFFYLADTAWHLFHYDARDVDTYLKSRADKRFTVIQTVIATFGGLDKPNAYGETVYHNQDPRHPNEAFFRNVDTVVEQVASHGFHVALVPIWSRAYVNEKRTVLDKAAARDYGLFLGTRYRDQPVIWILGGDWFPDDTVEIWREMAAGLNEGSKGLHLKTYHPTGQQTSAWWFHNEPWLDFNMVQSRHIIVNRTAELTAETYAYCPPKPVVEGESVYEGITSELLPYKPGVPVIEAHDVRRIAYCATFAGAAGYAYGSQGVWDHRDSGGKPSGTPSVGAPVTFAEGLDRPAGSQMQHLRALIESRPMELRVPDQWIIADDPGSVLDRIQACRGSDRSYAFFYSSMGKPVRVRLRDKIHNNITGNMGRAWWFNPRTGTATLIGEFLKTEAGDTQADVLRGDIAKTFTPPTSGSGNDWVLVVDDAAKNYPAPGRKS